jgi:NAD(P)-dependent dehydrogenase (short-subunit alcohol dehydrogenase family)
LFRLDGKVAVVTGGGRGIGVMVARGLLQAGATVYLSSRKKAELDAAGAAWGAPLGDFLNPASTRSSTSTSRVSSC